MQIQSTSTNPRNFRLIKLSGSRHSDQSLSSDFLHRLAILEQKIQTLQTHKTRISIKTNLGYALIDVNQIIRCEASGNYTQVYLLDESSHLVSQTMKQFTKFLTPEIFIRTHQSHTVNKSQIRFINLNERKITLNNGSIIPLSRQKKAAIKSLFINQYK